MNFSTAFSTNAVSICNAVGLKSVSRIEMSTRYLFETETKLTADIEEIICASLHDRMTECRYKTPLTSFELPITPSPVYFVDVMNEGRAGLQKANNELGRFDTLFY